MSCQSCGGKGWIVLSDNWAIQIVSCGGVGSLACEDYIRDVEMGWDFQGSIAALAHADELAETDSQSAKGIRLAAAHTMLWEAGYTSESIATALRHLVEMGSKDAT